MPEIKSPDLQVNQAVEGQAPDSQLVIAVDPANPLKTGTYVFQLQVVDNASNTSQPTSVKIVVVDDQAPNAVIDAPERVGFGRGFTLSGKRSFDVGGSVERFIWTLLQTPS
jgi:hypothetical protein